MQTQNRLLDDLARVAAGAVGGLTGMRHEVETRLREQFERILGRMNLVSREEFEVVQAMAAKARAEQEALTARLAQLEARLEELSGKTERPAARRKDPGKGSVPETE
jgi:BMFP domain-containing protein YqiC